LLFKNQAAIRGATNQTFVDWAVGLGMDRTKFEQALTSGKYTQLVKDENAAARKMGIPGTPSLMVDGQLIKGASGGVPSNEELAAAVDRAAAVKK
jgi:predicted DsbA family dithiol-disulfide isomerase